MHTTIEYMTNTDVADSVAGRGPWFAGRGIGWYVVSETLALGPVETLDEALNLEVEA